MDEPPLRDARPPAGDLPPIPSIPFHPPNPPKPATDLCLSCPDLLIGGSLEAPEVGSDSRHRGEEALDPAASQSSSEDVVEAAIPTGGSAAGAARSQLPSDDFSDNGVVDGDVSPSFTVANRGRGRAVVPSPCSSRRPCRRSSVADTWRQSLAERSSSSLSPDAVPFFSCSAGRSKACVGKMIRSPTLMAPTTSAPPPPAHTWRLLGGHFSLPLSWCVLWAQHRHTTRLPGWRKPQAQARCQDADGGVIATSRNQPHRTCHRAPDWSCRCSGPWRCRRWPARTEAKAEEA